MGQSLQSVALMGLGAVVLLSGVLVVQSRNLVHAGYWLLPCFLGVAGLYGLLDASFFFAVQIMLYAGAILVLILFALMLTRDVMNPHIPQNNRWTIPAAVLCLVVGILLVYSVGHSENPSPSAPFHYDITRQIGEALIGKYVLPFEAATLLLLAALVGAVVLARTDRNLPDTAQTAGIASDQGLGMPSPVVEKSSSDPNEIRQEHP